MNEQFEALAKTIFNHEHSGRGSPAAIWDQQSESGRKRYRVAAMVSQLITIGPIYRMEVIQETTSETDD